jgi:hypothetical protein
MRDTLGTQRTYYTTTETQTSEESTTEILIKTSWTKMEKP